MRHVLQFPKPTRHCGTTLLLFGFAIWVFAPVAVAENLFVADSGSGRIYKFTPSGVQSTFATMDYSMNMSLAFDSGGNLFVTASNRSDIYKYTPDGV